MRGGHDVTWDSLSIWPEQEVWWNVNTGVAVLYCWLAQCFHKAFHFATAKGSESKLVLSKSLSTAQVDYLMSRLTSLEGRIGGTEDQLNIEMDHRYSTQSQQLLSHTRCIADISSNQRHVQNSAHNSCILHLATCRKYNIHQTIEA